MGRSPCCAKEGLNRGAWTAMEDKILIDYIKIHGEGQWRDLPKRAGMKRCGKSCRLRWLNYLRPDIKRGNITADEKELIVRLHKLLGNRWSLIAGRLPGRTDNEIKNYWNTNLSKKAQGDNRQSCFPESKKKKDMKATTLTMQVVPPQKPTSDVVIRTKAFKCTKVVLNPPALAQAPPLPPQTPPLPLVSIPMRRLFAKTCTNTETDKLILSKQLSEGPLLDFSTTEFSMMGEFNFSDFLDSEQMVDKYGGLYKETCTEGDQISPSPSLEEPIVLSEEMMEDWCRSGGVLDAPEIEFWLGW